MRSCGKMYGTELFTLDMPQITSNSAVHWVYRIIRDPEYKRYQLVCTKRVLDPTTFLTFLLRALVGWHPIKCRFIIISLNKYVHGWFSSWPPINVVVTKKRYMQMNTKERPSKPFLLFLRCMFQTKRGSLVQTHLKMDVVERWTIQTINERGGRKGGTITAIPHMVAREYRNTASQFTQIPKPQLQMGKSWRCQSYKSSFHIEIILLCQCFKIKVLRCQAYMYNKHKIIALV